MQPRPLAPRPNFVPQSYGRSLPARPGMPQSSAFDRPKDFSEALRTVWRNRRMVVLCTSAVTAIALIGALILPSTYAADSHVEVGTTQPRIWTSDPQAPLSGPDAAKIESARIAAQSRNVAERVLTDLHLDRNAEFNAGIGPLPTKTTVKSPDDEVAVTEKRNVLVDRLLTAVDVTILGRSNVLNIDAKAHDPDLAAAIANDWANAYLEQDRSQKLAENARVENYLTTRIADLRQ